MNGLLINVIYSSKSCESLVDGGFIVLVPSSAVSIVGSTPHYRVA